MRKTALLAFLFLTTLWGCRLGPKYEPPCVNTPEDWKSTHADCTTPQVAYWWEIFDDPTLNSLELQAVANNPNLYVAFERVIEALAMAGVTRADLFPQLNVNPSYTNTAVLYKVFLPPGGISTLLGTTTLGPIALPTTAPVIPPFRIHMLQYVLPLNLSFQLDLWGKIKSQYESAVFNAQAQADAFYATLLSLTSNVATSYFQMRSLDSQTDMLKATYETRLKGLKITEARFKEGISPYINVSAASLDLTNAEAAYYDSLRQRALQENMIATLIGVPPSSFNLPHNPLILSLPPPVIPPGVPSSILLQRPDIAQAERNMAAENALVGAAYASFFPSLTLTGALGFSSPDLKDFLSWKSRLWQIGLNATQVFFDGERLAYNLAAAKARYKEATGAYQQQVLTAFREVEDALNNIEMQAKQAESLEKSAEAATLSTRLSTMRYKQGIADYLEVVVYNTTELNAKISLITTLGNRYLSTVQLIQALGGSWKTDNESCMP